MHEQRFTDEQLREMNDQLSTRDGNAADTSHLDATYGDEHARAAREARALGDYYPETKSDRPPELARLEEKARQSPFGTTELERVERLLEREALRRQREELDRLYGVREPYEPPRVVPITDPNLARDFSYHPPQKDQEGRYEMVNAAARAFAAVVLRACPAGADRAVAYRCIREARMWANASIATAPR